MYNCDKCGKTFSYVTNLNRHKRGSCAVSNITDGPPAKKVKISTVVCVQCDIELPSNLLSAHNRSQQHKANACVQIVDGVEKIQSAFKCRIASYRISSENKHTNHKLFLSEIKEKTLKLIHNELERQGSIKINMELFSLCNLQVHGSLEVKSFNTTNKVVDESSDVGVLYDTFGETMMAKAEEFNERQSGWSVVEILYLEVNINKYNPISGSSYIPLPNFIQKKNAIVNIKNNDQYCFAWAITSALFKSSHHVDCISSYPHFRDVLNVTDLEFPMKLKDISKFEKLNNISVHVYGLEQVFKDNKFSYEVVGPLRYAKKILLHHVNLLLLVDDHSLTNHYVWIKSMSRLLSTHLSKHKEKKHFCDGCLLWFNTLKKLESHKRYDCNYICTSIPSTKLRTDKFGKSTPENKLKFENFEKQLAVPFVVYADFESVLKPLDSCDPNPEFSFTNKTFKHEAYSFAYYIKCSFDDSKSKIVLYRGSDAAIEFVNRLEGDLKQIYNKHLSVVVPMIPLTQDEENEFQTASVCAICNKPFEEDDVKVRDHCHLTGKKRFGAAHSICNLNYKLPYFVPIIMHNMSNYDSHLFIKQLCSNKESVDVIAQTKEKYISFTKRIPMKSYTNSKGHRKNAFLQMRFIDSFKFLSASLQNLANNLSSEQMTETRKSFPNDIEFNLMRQKGVFPYSFVDNLSRLDYEILPTKEQFYDKLNEENISDVDYDRAKQVWNLFNCCNLGEYSDLYLKTDVCLLADIFENFRRKCLDTYNLDPAHYYTCPGLAWDAMLRITNVELDLLTDIEMIHLFKSSIRGGISQCSERMHIANNQFLPNYNPNQEESFITYLDATNLYGHSMSQPLPTGEFMWMNDKEIAEFDVMKVSCDNLYGYVLDVDMHYPEELQYAHSDLPFLVENVVPPNSKSDIPKLIPNLYDKEHYVVHYKTLQQAIQHGLVIKKIHRVLRFAQSRWLKKYIDMNTEMRNKTTNKFEKDTYKFMNNAVFGKTMENVDHRKDIKLITRWENNGHRVGAEALIARPNFKTCAIFDENLVAIHMEKLNVIYNKPIYVGFSILDLSKTVLYGFFYDVIKKHFSERASLLYTDTDSLIIKVLTNNFYEFIEKNNNHFDTSNYKEGNKFNIPKSASILGKMKDEFPNDPIISFYGTGAKAYCVQSVSTELKKAKGIKKSVITNHLTIEDYKKIVVYGGQIFRKMNTFISNSHDIYTEMKNKVALSHKDDKRFIIPNTTKTLPWGHRDITCYLTAIKSNLDILISEMNKFQLNAAVERRRAVVAELDAEIARLTEERAKLTSAVGDFKDIKDFIS